VSEVQFLSELCRPILNYTYITLAEASKFQHNTKLYTWKVFKSGAREEWRRSVRPIV